MLKRIFEDGLNSQNRPIGIKADGTPIKLVDTGSMRESFSVERGAIGFSENREYFLKIEEKYGTIFRPTEQELEIYSEARFQELFGGKLLR